MLLARIILNHFKPTFSGNEPLGFASTKTPTDSLNLVTYTEWWWTGVIGGGTRGALAYWMELLSSPPPASTRPADPVPRRGRRDGSTLSVGDLEAALLVAQPERRGSQSSVQGQALPRVTLAKSLTFVCDGEDGTPNSRGSSCSLDVTP